MSRGHIRKRGKSYAVVIEARKELSTDKRKRVWFSAKTKEEAEKILTEKLHDMDLGIKIYDNELTICEYLNYWLDNGCNNIRISTKEGYKRYIFKHIIPHIGNIKLNKLAPLKLQKFYTTKVNAGLSGTTVLQIHRILHKAFTQALKWQLIHFNVADCVEIPKKSNFQANFLNAEEMTKLLNISKGTPLYIPILIATTTGMRRGEVLGLTWSNIDFDNNKISIVQSLQQINKNVQLSKPKTKKSTRMISLPQALKVSLLQHRNSQIEVRQKMGELYIDKDFVCAIENGSPITPSSLNHFFCKFIKKSNLPYIRFHDLRHSYASLLVALGVQPKYISDVLGHSTIGITMDLYSHVNNSSYDMVADSIDNILLGAVANG
jgi:integrase